MQQTSKWQTHLSHLIYILGNRASYAHAVLSPVERFMG